MKDNLRLLWAVWTKPEMMAREYPAVLATMRPRKMMKLRPAYMLIFCKPFVAKYYPRALFEHDRGALYRLNPKWFDKNSERSSTAMRLKKR